MAWVYPERGRRATPDTQDKGIKSPTFKYGVTCEPLPTPYSLLPTPSLNFILSLAKQSVSGLRSECLPFWEVLAQSVANIAPTATPVINLALVYASAGNGTWLAYVIATIGLIFVSFNINQFASRSASPGSLYSYISKGLGPTAGVLCGWGLVLAYVLTAMAVISGFASYGEVLFSVVGLKISPIFLFAICAGLAWYVACLFPVPNAPFNVFPFLFLMYLVVGATWLLMVSLHSPEIIDEMKQDIEAIHTKFNEMKKV